MKYRYLLILLLFCVSAGFAQEVCDNAIDDDSDGLIDLNDPDCTCLEVTEITSLIPNPSFEQYDTCPTSFSQLSAATDWIQATLATTDYLNTCGYIGAMDMLPFPDGNAIVGAIIREGWKEYLGTCLNSPILAGNEYELKFHIASKPENGQLGIGNLGQIYYGDVEITLFGAQNCTSLPVATSVCPTAADPSWFVLGTATYSPVGEWGILTISFTPSVNVDAIMLGSPCSLPEGYVAILNENGFADPYFMYDNLLLNEARLFNGVTISSTGDICSNDIILHSTLLDPGDENYAYQWYLNGIAILGAVNADLAISDYNAGNYSLVVRDESNCYVSNIINLDLVEPITFDISSGCVQNAFIAEATLTSGSFENVSFQWNDANGNPIGTNAPTVNLSEIIQQTPENDNFPLTFGLTVTTANGCEFSQVFPVPSVFCTIPKGVSVNNDGDNDFFNLDGLNVRHLDVYNRYGMIVYSRDNYRAEWNGQSNSGKELPDGTYYYYITFDDRQPETGWVHLIRKQ